MRKLAREQSQIRIRLPEVLKAWLEDQAESNFRSMNAELVALIDRARRAAMGAAAAGTGSKA